MERQKRTVWSVAAFLVASILLTAHLTMSGDLSNGKEAYSTRCLKCHGEDGKGSNQVAQMLQTEVPDISSKEVQAKSDRELLQIINKGKGKMPAFQWSMEQKDREEFWPSLGPLEKGEVWRHFT